MVRSFAHPARALAWLGGAGPDETVDRLDRSTYQTIGFLVALTVVLTWAVLASVVSGGPVGVLVALGGGLLVGAVGRLLATSVPDPGRAPARRVVGALGRGLVAVALGVVVGELAAVGVLDGSLGGALTAQAESGVPASAGAPARWLDTLTVQRADLDRSVADASARRDQALVVARCEYRPGPGCPTNQITGDPGSGAEARDSGAALAAEERNLADARARRDAGAPGLDRDIARARGLVDSERSEVAGRVAEPGPGARWLAMNAYTTHDAPTAGPLLLRIGLVALFVLLIVLPLVLRLWRGPTEQDRDALALRVRGRAERDAVTEVAVRRARVAAALELHRQDRLLTAGPAPAGAGDLHVDDLHVDDLDRDRADRDRLLGTGRGRAAEPLTAGRDGAGTGRGGGEGRSDDRTGSRTAATRPGAARDTAGEPAEAPGRAEIVPASAHTPARRSTADLTRADAAPPARRPLDLLPGPLPTVARTMTGLGRALVPGPVARVMASAPNPLRTARTLWEEVEELNFTLRRTHTVRIEQQESGAPGPRVDTGRVVEGARERDELDDDRSRTLVEQLHPDPAGPDPAEPGRTALDPDRAGEHPEVPADRGRDAVGRGRRRTALTRGRRELPPGEDRPE
ncbi:MAG TPA: DUF4407 domain-containing protein [Pseudonocardia sp.]